MQKIYIYTLLGDVDDRYDVGDANIFLSLNDCFNYIIQKECNYYYYHPIIMCGIIDNTGITIVYQVDIIEYEITRDDNAIWFMGYKMDFEIDIDTTEDERLLQLFKMMK